MGRNWDDELFDAPEPKPARVPRRSGPTFDVPTHDEAGNPHTKKKQADIKRGMRADYEEQETHKALENRVGWERSGAGKERRRDIRDLASSSYREALSARGMQTEGGRIEKGKKVGMTHSQLYGAMGVTHVGKGLGENPIPDLEDPHAAPIPTRWEDMTPEARAHTRSRLKRVAGTSPEKMATDFGAQLDQGYHRALQAGATRRSTGEPVPFTKHFYDEHPEDAPAPVDRPNQMLVASAKSADIPKAVMTGVMAITSPNTKFTAGTPGNRHSPNLQAAESAVYQHQAGVRHEDMTQGVDRRGGINQGYPANFRKAGKMLEHVDSGEHMGTFGNWGPKTGPFVNSFQPDVPDFLVADVHTGGGGMFPHLSSQKPFRRDEYGEVKTGMMGSPLTEKSEREKAMEGASKGQASFHAVADYAARNALKKRGMGTTVRQAQAVQWGEEQLQRKSREPKLGVPSHQEAYGHANLNGEQFAGQGKLF